MIVLALAFLVGSAAFATHVPQAAWTAAQERLDLERRVWGADMGRRWSLDPEMDVSTLRLGEPFVTYYMRREAVDCFVASEGRGFIRCRSGRLFDFPVLAQDRLVYSMFISLNQKPDGTKLVEAGGEFTFVGGREADNPITNGIVRLRAVFPLSDGYEVALAYTDFGICYVVYRNGECEYVQPYSIWLANLFGFPRERFEEARRRGTETQLFYETISINEAAPILKEYAVESIRRRR